MNESELQERIERAEKNCQKTTQGRPNSGGWGFYSYGDAPAAAGGGIGTFVWFTDREEMLRFIVETLPFCPPGPGHFDPCEIAARVQAVVHEMNARSINDEAGLIKLNQVLKSFSQIEWLGTSADLLEGGHPYARQVRAAFRSSRQSDFGEGEISSLPIREDEKDAFWEFLGEWGL